MLVSYLLYAVAGNDDTTTKVSFPAPTVVSTSSFLFNARAGVLNSGGIPTPGSGDTTELSFGNSSTNNDKSKNSLSSSEASTTATGFSFGLKKNTNGEVLRQSIKEIRVQLKWRL